MDELEKLKKDFAKADGNKRSQIVGKITALKDRRSIPFLFDLLDDADKWIVSYSARALGKMKDKSAIKKLIELLDHDDFIILDAAAEALRMLKDPCAVPALLKRFKKGDNADDEVAKALVKIGVNNEQLQEIIELVTQGDSNAIKILGQMKKTEAVEPLCQLLKRCGQLQKREIARSLAKIGDRRAVPYLTEMLGGELWIAIEAAKALRKTGVDSIAAEQIMQRLERNEMSGIYAAGALSDPRAAEHLASMLSNEKFRKIAGQSLVHMGKVATPILISLVESNDILVARRAVEILGKIKDPRALDVLIKAIEGKDAIRKRKAAQALGKIKDRRAVKSLISTLNNKSKIVRRNAAEALVQIADVSSVPALIKGLKDDDYEVKKVCAYTIRRIGFDHLNNQQQILCYCLLGRSKYVSEIKEPSFQQLIEMLSYGDLDNKTTAALALGVYGNKPAVPALIKGLEDENYAVRVACVEALRAIGDLSAVPALIKGLNDENKVVRKVCANTLRNFADPSAVPALIKGLKDENLSVRAACVEALGIMRAASAVPVLINMIKERNSDMREKVVSALGSIGDARGASILINVLKDRNKNVRKSAASALQYVGEAALEHMSQAYIEGRITYELFDSYCNRVTINVGSNFDKGTVAPPKKPPKNPDEMKRLLMKRLEHRGKQKPQGRLRGKVK